jgi:thiamine-monophosphate kinase
MQVAEARLMRESEIIALFRRMATHPAARGLVDDAAVWSPPVGRELVLTHDVIVEGVHYLAADNPSDIAWKLVAVNLSDLAAKGALPAGVLVGLTFGPAQDREWIERFASGLERVLSEFGVPLFGGDTTQGRGPASMGLTAIGHVPRGEALARTGAAVGDDVYVTGTIGDAGLGLAIACGEAPPDKALLRRYRLPVPRLKVGAGLFRAGATAAMDVSDGLLIDAARMAEASHAKISIRLSDIPLSAEAAARLAGDDGRLQAATAGDDYELLFTAPPAARAGLLALGEAARVRVTRIGCVTAGHGLEVLGAGGAVLTPERLGYEHGVDGHGG